MLIYQRVTYNCTSMGWTWHKPTEKARIFLPPFEWQISWYIIWLVVWNIFMFPNSWDDDPIWLIFFREVETTNQNISIKNPQVGGVYFDPTWRHFGMRSMKPRGYGPNPEWGDASQILLVLCEGFYPTSETHTCWPGRYSPQHPLDYCIRSLLDNNVETTIQPMFNTESVVCFKGLKWLCHFPNYFDFCKSRVPRNNELLLNRML